jgi:Tfp pilus assembly protein PilN
MSAKKKHKINLLPKEAFSDSVAGRILLWILTTFRILVIATEIIVMVAFLSRFWLDAQNTDLNDELELKQSLLEASLPFEQEFKNTQAKLEIVTNIYQSQIEATTKLNSLTKSLTSNTILESINVTKTGVQINGVSAGEKSLQQLLANLSANNDFKNVTLTQVKPEDSIDLLSFTIDMQI